ncbi:MAG TPA: aldo/keto reductase [Myxococcota bacterium]|nr:aldo/keto reductase [Myxococcota bacterium]
MQAVKARAASIPGLGLGTWQLQGEVCAERVADALAIGYRHLDTAQAYENHAEVGRGLRASGIERDEVFLTTKLWRDNLEREAVFSSMEASLRELDTDYVDLLLVHWPHEAVDLEETLDAMRDLQARDRVRHLGVSNFTQSQVEEAAEIAPIVCEQAEYHPLLSQDPLLASLRARDMAFVAYSPLAHGRVFDQTVISEIARAHERSEAQIALRWLLQQPSVCAIPKAAQRDHLEEDFRVFDFMLEEEEMDRLHELADRASERVIDPDFAPEWER